jgi:hypothetical protein
MQTWQHCRADFLYYDDIAETGIECQVRTNRDEIVVSYNDDGPVVYKGIKKGKGHFELKAPKINGRASLHMFENSKFLEGFWDEDGYKGMWRIWLG